MFRRPVSNVKSGIPTDIKNKTLEDEVKRNPPVPRELIPTNMTQQSQQLLRVYLYYIRLYLGNPKEETSN